MGRSVGRSFFSSSLRTVKSTKIATKSALPCSQMPLSLRIHHFSWGILLLIGFSSISALPKPVEVPVQIPYCPVYSRVIRRPDGEARKCLPHQLNLCLNALDDQSLIDARGVCCYHNQVDYFCCMDIPTRLCPSYRNVTVVIHNNFPQSPFPVRSFHFRKGLTTEIENLSAVRTLKKN